MVGYNEGKENVRILGNVKTISGITGIESHGQVVGTASVNITFSHDIFQVDIQNQHQSANIYIARNGGVATPDELCFKLGGGEFVSWETKVISASGVSLVADASGVPVFVEGLY